VAAQQVASLLRKRAPTHAVLTELRSHVAGQAKALVAHASRRRLRVVLPHAPQTSVAGGLVAATRRAVRRQLAATVLHWTWARLGEFLEKSAAEFIAGTEGPEDGVRLSITFRSPPGLDALAAALKGRPSAAADWPPKQPAAASIAVHPGPKHD